VIDGLPESYGGLERRQAQALGDTDAMTSRQLQRIEQGMGRGVRSANDYCVVVLMGARLAQLIADPSNLDRFSPATRAQVELSGEVAENLEGKGLSHLTSAMQQVLDRDQSWVTLSRARLTGIKYPDGSVDDAVVNARLAYNAAAVGKFEVAVEAMSKSANATQDPLLKGWRQEEVAVYKHPLDAAAAQRILDGAVSLNPRVMKPMQGITARRVTAADNQAQAAARFLSERYEEPSDLIVGVNALLEDLSFDPDRTDEFEDALERLGKHLGFVADRPERNTGKGPDVLWAVGERSYLVIECKSGATSADEIYKRDVAQLAHSMNWFEQTYPKGSICTAVLIHPQSVLAPDATAPTGCRIITTEKLESLCGHVSAMAVALADGRSWGDVAAVGEQLRSQLLTGGAIIAPHSVPPQPAKPAR
jgi:hypothetical protein